MSRSANLLVLAELRHLVLAKEEEPQTARSGRSALHFISKENPLLGGVAGAETVVAEPDGVGRPAKVTAHPRAWRPLPPPKRGFTFFQK